MDRELHGARNFSWQNACLQNGVGKEKKGMKKLAQFFGLGLLSAVMGVATFGQNASGPGTYQTQDHSMST
jgi:ketopantoate reductase